MGPYAYIYIYIYIYGYCPLGMSLNKFICEKIWSVLSPSDSPIFAYIGVAPRNCPQWVHVHISMYCLLGMGLSVFKWTHIHTYRSNGPIVVHMWVLPFRNGPEMVPTHIYIYGPHWKLFTYMGIAYSYKFVLSFRNEPKWVHIYMYGYCPPGIGWNGQYSQHGPKWVNVHIYDSFM